MIQQVHTQALQPMQQEQIYQEKMVYWKTRHADQHSSNKHTTSGYSNGRPSVQFSVTPDAGFQLDVTSISVDIRRNPKGPASWRLAYSTDGGATWTNSGTDFAVASSGCFTNTNLTWDVDDFSTTSTLWVRVIGHTAYSSLNGVSTLKNIDVQVLFPMLMQMVTDMLLMLIVMMLMRQLIRVQLKFAAV